MKKQVVALVVVILLLLVAFSFTTKSEPVLTTDDAMNAVKKDVQRYYPGAEVTVLTPVVELGNSSWKINVKITIKDSLNACCPKVILRYYELLPIRFHEELITRQCSAGKPLVYEEEAVIAAGKSPEISREFCFKKGVQASALFYKAERVREMQKCTAECTDPEKAVSKMPVQDLWVVQWTLGGYSKYAALDKTGQVLNIVRS